MYQGVERRQSTDEERAQWLAEHDRRPWHASIPKPLLVSALVLALGVVGWFESRWRESVEDRLGGVGAQILEMRKDWLEDARRAAQRDGDRDYVRHLNERLRALEGQAAPKKTEQP